MQIHVPAKGDREWSRRIWLNNPEDLSFVCTRNNPHGGWPSLNPTWEAEQLDKLIEALAGIDARRVDLRINYLAVVAP